MIVPNLMQSGLIWQRCHIVLWLAKSHVCNDMYKARYCLCSGSGQSRYMSNFGKKHWEAVKGVMRYLNGTKEFCICFGKKETCLLGYTDADYAGDMDKRRSTLGYVFIFTGGAVSWQSHLQNCMSMSTTEAEYTTASEAWKEAIWLARLVGDLGISIEGPTLHCDSQSTLSS